MLKDNVYDDVCNILKGNRYICIIGIDLKFMDNLLLFLYLKDF